MEAIIAKLKSQKAALAAELGRIDAAIAVLSGRMKKSWAERKRKAASQ